LEKIYPKSVGLYYFAKEALGDLSGFITGFSFYVSCFVGDETFTYNNFLPISPLNIFKTPLDILAVSIFAPAIYMWALRNGIKRNLRQGTLT
jgi:hypothetical protein